MNIFTRKDLKEMIEEDFESIKVDDFDLENIYDLLDLDKLNINDGISNFEDRHSDAVDEARKQVRLIVLDSIVF